MEDVGVATQTVDAFLNARSAGIIDKDKGAAGLQRKSHHIGYFVAVRLSCGSANHGEVLTGQVDQATIDGGAAGNDSVSR